MKRFVGIGLALAAVLSILACDALARGGSGDRQQTQSQSRDGTCDQVCDPACDGVFCDGDCDQTCDQLRDQNRDGSCDQQCDGDGGPSEDGFLGLGWFWNWFWGGSE
ncbi:MAG: hypothetical protein HQ582_13915 [Planctomycetes bacterium]|nr:hypothetical protein [Planctomycetota bacterium]